MCLRILCMLGRCALQEWSAAAKRSIAVKEMYSIARNHYSNKIRQWVKNIKKLTLFANPKCCVDFAIHPNHSVFLPRSKSSLLIDTGRHFIACVVLYKFTNITMHAFVYTCSYLSDEPHGPNVFRFILVFFWFSFCFLPQLTFQRLWVLAN